MNIEEKIKDLEQAKKNVSWLLNHSDGSKEL